MGKNEAIRRCDALLFDRDQSVTNTGTGGYGYSVAIGTYTTGFFYDALPVKRSLLTRPEQTIMFADHASIDSAGKFQEQIDLYAPFYLDFDEVTSEGSWPTMHFRHRGKAPTTWTDGHVSQFGPLTTTCSAWGASEAQLRAGGIGWAGGTPEEALQYFKVRK